MKNCCTWSAVSCPALAVSKCSNTSSAWYRKRSIGSAEVSRDTPPALLLPLLMLLLLLGEAAAASPAAAGAATATTAADSGCELALLAASAAVLPCTGYENQLILLVLLHWIRALPITKALNYVHHLLAHTHLLPGPGWSYAHAHGQDSHLEWPGSEQAFQKACAVERGQSSPFC